MNSDTKKEMFLIFLLLACAYGYFFHEPKWNGNSRLGLTFAIVEEGRLTIDSFINKEGMDTGDKSFYNGHFYSDKAIGSSLVAVLFYWPIYQLENLLNFELSLRELKYILTFLSIGLPSAIAGSLMYIFLRQVTANSFWSFVSTMSIYLGTMVFPFSVIFFGHQLVSSLLLGVFLLIFKLKSDIAFRKNRVYLLIGVLIGFALITEYTAAPVILILLAYFIFSLFSAKALNRKLAVFLLAFGASIPLSILILYNAAVFQNPFSFSYSHVALPYFNEENSHGILGITLPKLKAMFYLSSHPAMGLFWQSPVLLLAIPGAVIMWRKKNYRTEAVISIASLFSMIIMISGYYNWWGGSTFGPRYLIPMLPLLGLPLAFIPKRWFLFVVILGIVSSLQMLIVVSSRITVPEDFFWTIDNQGFFAYSTIYSFCLPMLLQGGFSKNLGNELFGLYTWKSLIPLLVVTIPLTLFILKKEDLYALGEGRKGDKTRKNALRKSYP